MIYLQTKNCMNTYKNIKAVLRILLQDHDCDEPFSDSLQDWRMSKDVSKMVHIY